MMSLTTLMVVVIHHLNRMMKDTAINMIKEVAAPMAIITKVITEAEAHPMASSPEETITINVAAAKEVVTSTIGVETREDT